MSKNIVILGGGTAGWITAVQMRTYFPKSNITVIQNEDIGVIGVGEATVPNIISFLNENGIRVEDVIRNTGGTIKNGISFENWNGDGEKYFHGFHERLVNFQVPNIFRSPSQAINAHDTYIKKLIEDGLPLNEYLYTTKMSYENKVDLQGIVFALHFDAVLFARFLENIGRERGINVINGNYTGATQHNDGTIKSLILDGSREIEGDFFFDCSGLARLLIGKLYNTKWISYRDHLPMKSAIPFWTEHEEHIPPYTRAIAMPHGWIWKIPLQHRNGCGYVFDSDYITPEQAQKEAEEYLGHKIEVKKVIEFEAGRFEKVWVKNCIAVGLAGSFVEPLESTSIFLTIGNIDQLREFINEFDNPDQSSADVWNEIAGKTMEEIVNFIYLHYCTKRNDTEFWRTFRDKHPMPEEFVERFEKIKRNKLRSQDIPVEKISAGFPLSGYLQVYHGLRCEDYDMNLSNMRDVQPTPTEYKKLFDKNVMEAPYHNQILNMLKGA
jgi:tryptophan halogenase